MGIKISKPKIKIKKPKIKLKAPKITVGKDLGAKNIGKTLSSAASSAGKIGKNLSQAAESSLKSQLKLMTGDFKGAGKEALEGFSAGSNIAGEVGGNIGGLVGDRKSGDIAGRLAADVAANLATSGGYGAAKTAAGGLAKDGLKGLLSDKGLEQAALSAAGSYAGIDPNMLKMVNMGASALTGDKAGLASGLASQFGAGSDLSQLVGAAAGGKDIKGAALQQLGSMAGFDPKQLQMGLSAITGNKAGLASGLASQFGAGDTASSMIGQFAGGKGAREVISDQAGAYANDEVNQALDRAGVSREGVKQLENQIKRAPAAIKEAAQSQYQIARGDTFNAIAKKMGVTPEQLRAANPQIKDINKIAAGAKLNLPGATNEIQDLSGPLREGVVESGQMTEEQFDEARNQDPSFLDQAKNFLGGAADSAANFAARNRGKLGLAADAAAALAGYEFGQTARQEAVGFSKEQLQDLKTAGKNFEAMKYDPSRYGQEREFIKQRIAGGGVTAEERKMQQEGDIRAARAAAAQRLAGMEQQARMGAGATGAGAGLAAALAGGQAAMGEQSAANLAREASASQRLEQDIQRQTNLSRQQTSEEADLAQQQGQFGLSRAAQTAGVRDTLSSLSQARGAAQQNLASQGAEFAKRGLEMLKTPEEEAAEKAKRQRELELENLEVEAKRKEVYGKNYKQTKYTAPPPASQQSLETKAAAAQQLSQGSATAPSRTGSTPKPAQTNVGQFNQQNAPKPGEGRGYGVLAPVGQVVQQGQQAVQQVQNKVQQGQQAVQQVQNKVQSTVDQAKQKAEEFKNNPLGALGVKF